MHRLIKQLVANEKVLKDPAEGTFVACLIPENFRGQHDEQFWARGVIRQVTSTEYYVRRDT